MNEQSPVPPMSPEQYQAILAQMGTPTPKKSKVIPILLIVLVLLLASFGGALAYFKYVVYSPDPKEILKKAILASLEVKSFSFSITSSGRIENSAGQGLPSATNLSFESKGAFDFHAPDAVLLNANIGINASVRDATSTGSLVLSVDTLRAAKNFYLNLRKFNVTYTSNDPQAASSQVFIGMANGIAAAFSNKWIVLSDGKSTATSTVDLLVTEDINAIRDYVLGMRYVTSISNAGIETVNDIPMYHLKLSIQNGQELVDLIQKISKEKQSANIGGTPLVDKRTDDLLKTANQKVDLDIWIGRNDSLVYRIVSSPIVVSDTQTSTKSTTSHEIALGNYNQPVLVTTPPDAVPIEQVIQSVFGGMMNNKTTTPQSAHVQEQLSNARAAAELYFDSHASAQRYAKVCLKGQKDGIYSYVQSAATAAEVAVPVKRNAAATKAVAVCNDTASAWAAQVPLKSEGVGVSWCVDSTGTAKSETNKWLASGRAVVCP